MLPQEVVDELKAAWFPNLSASGLRRLIDLLEKGSPLLVHGCFTRIPPMGCLATHAGWHHPETCHLTFDAGLHWLHAVARLNPATSHVIQAWDRAGCHGVVFRLELLSLFREEWAERQGDTCLSQTPELASV